MNIKQNATLNDVANSMFDLTEPHKKLIIKHEQYPNPSFKVSPERKLSCDPYREHQEMEERTYSINSHQNERSE